MSRQEKLDLINGYIKSNLIDNHTTNNIHPLELNNLIFEYSGKIFIIFDIIHDPRYKPFICNEGKSIKGYLFNDYRQTFGCSSFLGKRIDIECVKPGNSTYNFIGITSNIQQCKQE